MTRVRTTFLRTVVSFLMVLLPAAALADATIVVTTGGVETVNISVVSSRGIETKATSRNGIAFVTLPESGTHTLTVATAAATESLRLEVPRAGTLSVFFDPAAPQRLLLQTVAHGEAITVTAPKREELLQQVPMSIEAFPAEEIESRGHYDFREFARSIPSVTLVDRGPTQTEIILRGISPIIGASTVGYHVDGLSLSSSFNQPSSNLFDVERVEVLRGPQGTLYGDGSMGGNINIISNKADASRYEQKLDLASSFTSAGGANYELNGMINVPLVKDRLALRIVGNTSDQSGWIDNPSLGLDDFNDARNDALRVSTRWIVSDRAILTINGQYQNARVGGPSEVNATLGDLIVDKQVSEPQHDRMNLYSLEFDYDLGWSDLTLISGAMLRDLDIQLDAGLGPEYPGMYTSGQQVVSAETRLASKDRGRLTWLGGLFLKQWGRNNTLATEGFPAAPGFVTPYVAAVEFDTNTVAVFGEAAWAFTDRLTGTVGLRAFQQREHDVTLDSLPELEYVLDDANLSKTFRDLSPKFGMAWQRTPSTLFFATVAKGYRAGGTNTLHATNPGAPLSYDADVVWSYELGAKTSTRSGRLVANAALFYSDWDNLQIAGTPENSLLGYTTNAGRARSQGLELELVGRPAAGLELEFGTTWADSVLREAAQGGEAGNRLPFIPELAWNASARYARPLSERFTGVLRADYGRRGDSYREVTNLPDTMMQAYSLADVRAGLETASWAAYVFVSNITDVRADYDRNAGLYFYRNQPRTVGINLKLMP